MKPATLSPMRLALRYRKLLWKVFLASLMVHVGAVLLASPLVLYSYFFQREVQFTPPPERQRRIEPRKLEYKVHVKQQQKMSGRPRVQPRLTANRLSELTLPDVKLDITPITSKALPMLRNFGSGGLGDGLGEGTGGTGLGLGQSAVNFFGIKARGERIFFIVDASKSMLHDERGGERGYTIVKDELARMINNLSGGTFFNVVTFSWGVDLFRDKMVLASSDNKTSLKRWIQPYNTEGKVETLQNAYQPKDEMKNYKAAHGTSRLDLALAAAFEQGADTVFVITDGEPEVKKKLSDEEWEAWQKKYHTEAEKARVAKETEALNKKLEEENKKRAKKGLPPKYLEYLPSLAYPLMARGDVLEYVKEMQTFYYLSKNLRPARVFVVGYETDAFAEGFLRDLTGQNQGRFRRLDNLVKVNFAAQ